MKYIEAHKKRKQVVGIQTHESHQVPHIVFNSMFFSLTNSVARRTAPLNQHYNKPKTSVFLKLSN
jgi:hypothetical protein